MAFDEGTGKCRASPDFRDKIAGADFSGKYLSQKSGAKVRLMRLTFATRRDPDSGPLRTWCRFQDIRYNASATFHPFMMKIRTQSSPEHGHLSCSPDHSRSRHSIRHDRGAVPCPPSVPMMGRSSFPANAERSPVPVSKSGEPSPPFHLRACKGHRRNRIGEQSARRPGHKQEPLLSEVRSPNREFPETGKALSMAETLCAPIQYGHVHGLR